MRIDGLEEPKGNPDVNGGDMEVASEDAVDERPENGSKSEDEDLERMSILRS